MCLKDERSVDILKKCITITGFRNLSVFYNKVEKRVEKDSNEKEKKEIKGSPLSSIFFIFLFIFSCFVFLRDDS